MAYLLGTLAALRSSTYAFNIGKVVILAMLFANIRAHWLVLRWAKDPEFQSGHMRRGKIFAHKLVNQMPAAVWPKARFVFYVLASLEIILRFSSFVKPVSQPAS